MTILRKEISSYATVKYISFFYILKYINLVCFVVVGLFQVTSTCMSCFTQIDCLLVWVCSGRTVKGRIVCESPGAVHCIGLSLDDSMAALCVGSNIHVVSVKVLYHIPGCR